MTKLFIGNLPYSTTSQDLQNMFAAFGQVLSASVVTDKFSGQSRGFGFVEMANDEEAQKAIQDLNNSQLGERPMSVSVARPREERPAGGGFNRGGGDRGGSRGGYDQNRRDRR